MTSYITCEEEEKIGIDPEDTDDYKATEGIFGSDDIRAMVEDEQGQEKRSFGCFSFNYILRIEAAVTH